VNNFYVDLYFFAKVTGAALVFRAVARRAPNWSRQVILILISLYFSCTLSSFSAFWPALGLYLLAALVLAQAISAAAGRTKSRLLGVACILSVAVLVGYKYGYRLPGPSSLGSLVSRLRGLEWIGLSYLTLKAIDYFVAIRSTPRSAVAGLQQGLYGLCYLIFFPTYISGPIQGYQTYVKDQLQPWRPMTILRFRDNVLRIAVGVIKILLLGKWAYANSILTYDVRAGEPTSLPALAASLYCYYLYFYFDFSGYCDVAIALADFLEVRVPENFRFPFLATSPQDFWNRWHITLAHWLRDLVFFRTLRSIFKRFPRTPELPASMASIFATFVLMGAWHGDSLNWVLYGCYHGAALSVELAYRRMMETCCPNIYDMLSSNILYNIICIIIMFNFIAWGLLLTLPFENVRHLSVFSHTTSR